MEGLKDISSADTGLWSFLHFLHLLADGSSGIVKEDVRGINGQDCWCHMFLLTTLKTGFQKIKQKAVNQLIKKGQSCFPNFFVSLKLFLYFIMVYRVVEFASYSDMKSALEKLDGTELNGRRIKLTEDHRRHRYVT